MDARILPLLKSQYGLIQAEVAQKFHTNGQREAYLLETEAGKLVLKITDPGRPEEIVRSDIGILDYVARFDFPAPRPLATHSRQLYLPFEDRFFYLYHFVEGKQPTPSAPMLAECGRLLARLHGLPVEAAARTSLHRPAYLLEDLRGWLAETPPSADQQDMAREIHTMIDSFPSFADLPETLIHTDPYFVNLLDGADGHLYLIDWEDAGISYPLIDVGYLGHLVTYLPHDRQNLGLPGDEPVSYRPDWAQAFLDGYQSVRKLNAAERELFPWAVRLNFLMYIWDWDNKRIIPENYQRMKILEGLKPRWE